ncbi:Fic family protein [Mucilaginibacter gotjawali]|uniref:Fic family protein n=2 Tax=Mucilaginibacter gotjawali TaxID=1550579 RepID=A0A839SBF6_9SPHI|nr:Fic family protein [Mucilaginibacter gotjawali]MBB3054290.1 Fic family protein [Mucilaginibacter gotjawali]BAU51876.1 Fic/DOC family protein [Mucilaginibacter gotjawali]
MEKRFKPTAEEILGILARFPDGANIDDIRLSNLDIPLRTLQRWLSKLSDQGKIIVSGKARATIYKLVVHNEAATAVAENESLIPLSESGKRIHALVTAPIQQRKPIGYQREFLESYRPNIDSYLTDEEKAKLGAIGDTKTDQPAGTYAQHILNRLLIDLSWNSSRLEGNTYSLLDTERLIEQGEADDTKSAKEAQMILNHKDAIEFIVQAAEETGFNRYTILNLHAMLANNLLADPQAPGRLRSMAVGISGSTFTPLAIPQLIGELFDHILQKVTEIENPFEQSFFVMVHLPYLQPFDDVNKRVSRISANIPFVKRNLSPLSFIDVPDDLYSQGMLGVYEQNDVSLLKDVFLWAYERSASRYAVIRQSLGEPDTFKLKYRTQIRDLISAIITDALNSKDAGKLIREKAEQLSEADKGQFIEAIETEILSLHEGNFARYRVNPKEFERWKAGW